jgi:6-phosphogluconolactonase
MSKFDLVTFASDVELADAAAQEFLRQLGSLPKAGPYCVALSGGRIARRFFSASANLIKTNNVELSRIHFFWGDERCVPPNDPESNFAIARDLLFAPLDLSAHQIHRIQGEQAPETAATEAEAELRRITPHQTDGQPVLDLVLLGMGEDGHVASLFPGEPEEAISSKAVFRPVTAAKPPPHRITLGYAAIAAARQVWVLASGAGKEAALRQSLNPAGGTPLARVLGLRVQTRIFTDIKI